MPLCPIPAAPVTIILLSVPVSVTVAELSCKWSHIVLVPFVTGLFYLMSSRVIHVRLRGFPAFFSLHNVPLCAYTCCLFNCPHIWIVSLATMSAVMNIGVRTFKSLFSVSLEYIPRIAGSTVGLYCEELVYCAFVVYLLLKCSWFNVVFHCFP